MIKSLCLLFMLGQSPLDSLEFISPAEIISQAESFEAEGDYEKAVELYLTVSKNDTSYIQVQNELMSAYNALKQYDKSIAIGILLKDEYSKLRNNIYTNLGNAYLDGGNIDKGIETYQVGLKLFPYNHILL